MSAQEHATQATHGAAQAASHGGGHAASEGFNAGETIINHVSNSSLDHPLIHLPTIAGIDLSVTKHVFMLWFVAAVVFVLVTTVVRRFLSSGRPVPTGFMSALEAVVVYIRDEIVQPNVGRKWVATWTPLMLTFFLFILTANAIGLVPVFDVVALIDHYVLHTAPDSFLKNVVHGGTTVTANFNVTAALAMITFGAIIVAGTKAHGFVKHWMNLVPHGMPLPLYVLLIPLEIIGMFVRPFALTMRLAANMTGGHIAILAILSMIFIMAETTQSAIVGLGMGAIALPLAVGVSLLEAVVVVPVQAFVFTLLTAVFIGMAIHAHH